MPSKEEEILSPELVKEFNMLLPKLKHALTPGQVIKWLENFEVDEIKYALEVLFFVEYLTENEIIQHLNERVEETIANIKDRKGSTKDSYKIAFVAVLPENDDGKSGSLMLYYLNKCPSFKSAKRKNIAYSKSHLDYNSLKEDTVLVFIDDFIGSGKTFEKFLKKEKSNFSSSGKILEVNLLSIFIMEDGEAYLKKAFKSKLHINSTKRQKALKDNVTPFNFRFKKADIENLIVKYGNQLPSDAYGSLIPRGYGDSEAMISFAHGTPNNTFPIIWSDSYNSDIRKTWHPILPRTSNSRIKKAKELKLNIAYWIGIMDRLGLQVSKDRSLKLYHEKYYQRKWNSKTMHSLLVVLKLKTQGYGNGIIAQILGITTNEFEKILNDGIRKSYLNKDGSINDLGMLFMKKVQETVEPFEHHELLKNNYAQMCAEEYIG